MILIAIHIKTHIETHIDHMNEYNAVSFVRFCATTAFRNIQGPRLKALKMACFIR